MIGSEDGQDPWNREWYKSSCIGWQHRSITCLQFQQPQVHDLYLALVLTWPSGYPPLMTALHGGCFLYSEGWQVGKNSEFRYGELDHLTGLESILPHDIPRMSYTSAQKKIVTLLSFLQKEFCLQKQIH